MQAEITTDGKKILAKIPCANGQGRDWAKMVPGARWNPNEKVWSYSLTMDTCRKFRQVFQGGLTVKPALSEWARAAIKAGKVLEDFRSGAKLNLSDGRMVREAPFLAAAIGDRSYQGSGVGFLMLANACILGDEPGLGKTVMTLGALIECDAKVILVGCPRTATRATWERETNRWAPGIATFVAQGDRAEREKVMGEFADHALIEPGMRKMLIINNEMIRAKRIEVCSLEGELAQARCLELGESPSDHKHDTVASYEWPFLFEQQWDAVVIDEAHNMLASTANIQSKRITQGRYGAMLLRRRVKDDGLAIALSGTPERSNMTKFWGTLNWCRPDVFTSFWNFAGIHFGVVDGRYGKIIADGSKVPEPLDKQAWDEMLRPYYLGRTKKAAAPDLPDIQYAGTPSLESENSGNYVWLEMDPKQAKAYREMEAMAEAEITGGTLSANGVLAEISRLRQFAVTSGKMVGEDFVPALPSNKIDWLMEKLLEMEGFPGKLLVASQYTQIVHLIDSELRKAGYRTLTLTGATSDKNRALFQKKFNDPDDPTKVGIINSKAGGESITLDGDCDEIVIIDPLWTEAEEFQLVSRIHRVSRIHQVIVHRLISIGTTEHHMVLHTDQQRAVVSSNKPQARRNAALEMITWPR